MNRREFCRKMGVMSGALVLAPLINACSSEAEVSPTSEMQATAEGRFTPARPTATSASMAANPTATAIPEATATAESMAQPTAASIIAEERLDMTRLVMVQTDDRSEGIRRALSMLDANPVRGNRVLLKPNYNSPDPPPASTHPEALRSLVEGLFEMGARDITVAERSGMGTTRPVLEQMGLFELSEAFGLQTVVLDELADSAWVVRKSGDLYWPEGFAVPRLLLDAECVVQICNLKTHAYGGHFTMSLKNSVGFVPWSLGNSNYNYMGALHGSQNQRKMIADINTAYEPSLIILDAVEAFVNGGPAKGDKVSPGLIIAGTDPVAIDAVGVAILRLFGTTPDVSKGRVFEQEQIARAAELGLGVDSPEKIGLSVASATSQPYADQILEALMA